MHVKFTNTEAAMQNVFKDGQMVAMLKPGESFVTDDADLIAKLQAQCNMEAEEVAAEEAAEAEKQTAAQKKAAAAEAKKNAK